MRWYDRLWYYAPRYWAWPLLPMSLLYRVALFFKTYFYRFKAAQRLSAAVVIVGNLSVGGTGKTPLVIHLVERFQASGIKVGVVSRGYGGCGSRGGPIEVNDSTPSRIVGDEPKLIYQKTKCPLAIGKQLNRAAQLLIDKYGVELILSDDGLQHADLTPTIEIVVVDGSRGFGNGYVLPAGPLREPVSRIKDVSFVVVNGALKPQRNHALLASHSRCYSMQLKATSLYTPVYDKHYAVDHFTTQRVHACAALANPYRFFETLESLGMSVVEHAYRDHHSYDVADFKFKEKLPIIMTAKDGVKWREIAEQGNKMEADAWILETRLELDENFGKELFTLLGYDYQPPPSSH